MSELPRGWVEAEASKICGLVQSGGTPKEGFIAQPGIPFLKVYNIVSQRIDFEYRPQFIAADVHRSSMSKSQAFPGDVLMNIVGPPLGKVAVIPPTFAAWNVNQALTIFRPSEAVTSEWLYFFLCGGESVKSVINETRGSAGQVNISLSQCRSFRIPLPPLAEQKRIVAKLDALNAKSARARTELARVEILVSRYKQAVLSKAFLNCRGRTMRLAELIEAGAPIRYGVLQPGSIRDVGVPLVRVCDLVSNRVKWDQLRRIESSIDQQFANARIQNGDILVSVVGTIGRIALVEGMVEPTNIARAVARLRPNPKIVVPEWVALRLQANDCQGSFSGDAREVARKTLNVSMIRAIKLVLPPLEEQQEIVRRIESAFVKIDRVAAEARRALDLVGKLDEAVLAKAFRGELVSQDDNDESAEKLLARIRTEREAEPKVKRGRGNNRG